MAMIMVVDDDVLIRSVLKRVLNMHRHEVIEAQDGQEALELIDPNALPNLILMDHKMPKLSGVDCARQLKKLYPFLKIILISGCFCSDDDGYLAAVKYLFKGIISKPFQIKDVVDTVQYALGTKQEAAAHSQSRPPIQELTSV